MNAERHPQHPLRRNLLGVFGLICLTVGTFFWIRPPELASLEFFQGSCIKSGLVLLAAWLAYPQLDRLPGWMFAVLIGFLLAVATRPRIVIALLRYAAFAAPIFLLIWLLRPKTRRNPIKRRMKTQRRGERTGDKERSR